MARLNDPPAPPTESIDALKRRFIRQNREIARVNSTQSQRIRNLETEISRLLAENIAIREQAIAAQAEADRWRHANSVNREVLDLKERLERKVKEVAALVGEMNDIPQKAARRQSRRRSGLPDLKSLNEADWKNRLAMKEALAKERGDALDGRLPSIHEDKLYPRRTLETAEMMALRDAAALQDSTESPDLGPPPVAHFDVQEPIKFDASRQSEHGSLDDVMQLPATLEKRRKRRNSALLQDMPKEEVTVAHQPPENPSQPLLRTGAKRKLDASELDELVLQQRTENDDFIFQRRQDNANGVNGGKKASRFTRPPGRENDNTSEGTTQSPQKSLAARKILAPKSTNSPAKRKIQINEKVDALKDSREDEQVSGVVKSSRRVHLPLQLETQEIQLKRNEDRKQDEIPPKTPAAVSEDILSPVSTEPSARNAHQTKEAAVLNSVEDVLNGSIGRGSRRARAAVSYAEPNLRDKMRRPGKELVGAVEGLEKNRETSSTTHSRGASLDRGRSEGEAEEISKVVRIKQERSTAPDDKWKELPPISKKEEPTSPLRDKEQRKEKDRDKAEHPQASKTPSTVSGRDSYGEELERAVDRLSIFDPPVSSPLEEPKDPTKEAVITSTISKRKAPSSGGVGRRHSMQPSSNPSSSIPSDPAPTTTGRLATRAPPPRPSSAASLRSDPSSASSTSNGTVGRDLKRSASTASGLRSARPGHGDGAGAGAGAASGTGTLAEARAERTASRRRSMMI